MATPSSTVFTMSTQRWPKRESSLRPIIFIPIAATACGMVKRPACHAGKPIPT
jgi:hypothetical protein